MEGKKDGWRMLLLQCLFCFTVMLSLSTQVSGAKCWECDLSNATRCEVTPDHLYGPEIPVDLEFCKNIRETQVYVKELCRRHIDGYMLFCVHDNKEERTCKHVCPREVKSELQRGSDAISRHALDFRFIMAAVGVCVWRLWAL